ncbi:MAG: ribosome silencing factor [Lachnospiraceae bacterium]|nr:ribosome silencing factor [Lachnospiraceae bacterium]
MSERSAEMAKLAYRCLENKKADNIQIIDISEISVIADYFLIAGGNNRNQIQAMSDHVEEELGKAGYDPRQIEGYNQSNWVLLDYSDIIIHIFDKESRSFYDLERLWKDGKPVDISDL